MKISPINVIAPKSYTKNGNEYRKSNSAKVVFTTVGAVSSGVVLRKVEGAISDLMSYTKNMNVKFQFSKSIRFLATLMTTLCSLGAGAVTDAIVSKANEIAADESNLASPQMQLQKENTSLNTHQGKL